MTLGQGGITVKSTNEISKTTIPQNKKNTIRHFIYIKPFLLCDAATNGHVNSWQKITAWL